MICVWAVSHFKRAVGCVLNLALYFGSLAAWSPSQARRSWGSKSRCPRLKRNEIRESSGDWVLLNCGWSGCGPCGDSGEKRSSPGAGAIPLPPSPSRSQPPSSSAPCRSGQRSTGWVLLVLVRQIRLHLKRKVEIKEEDKSPIDRDRRIIVSLTK